MNTKVNLKFEETYRNESDAIFRFSLVRVSNREQALDIMQETFLRLWKSLSADQEIHNVRAFLFTVAHHLIIDWYRKKKSMSLDSLLYNKEKETENDLPDETPDGNLELKAEGRYLLDKIRKLSDIYREAVYLRYVEDLSPREIGEVLGISANAASVRINRGILELRKKTGYDENN